MQSQLMCNGCRSVLLYPRGATNVCCAICNTITAVPTPVPTPDGVEGEEVHGRSCCSNPEKLHIQFSSHFTK